jgi:hypothetical protein
MNRQRRLFFVFVALALASFACGSRIFEKPHVYANPPQPLAEVYDSSTDRILGENAWVFRPDGTFEARLETNGERLHLSGTYDGDDTGSGFFFFLDTDGDGQSDDQVLLDTENDAYSYIEWQAEAGTPVRYWLAE